MGLRIWQVDAFTDRPFGGNPACVTVLDQPAEAGWMQNLAMEMNLSETAFLVPQPDGFGLRWFTPASEVALCGHATLASAHVLFTQGFVQPGQTIHFHTLSGVLKADRTPEGNIQLNFPATPATPAEPPAGLLDALGLSSARFVGASRFDYLVVVDDENTVANMKPDFTRLKEVKTRGTIVTAPASRPDTDFVSRFFAPVEDINEDSVTGSAHCCLTPYWRERLGKDEMRAYQASRRGGRLIVRQEGDRVFISGQAVTVFEGNLFSVG
jgi:PhzF family phenazine biosynthesis protein